MVIKEGDYIEIEYTGKTKDDGIIFDTTDEKVAKDNQFHNPKQEYGPLVVVVGQGQVLPGLDKFIIGKDVGSFSVELTPEEGFGKKKVELLKLMPKSVFLKQKINPMPGMPINVDNMNGIIKTVSGGRCMVDFNHPLSAKELTYELKINRIVTDEKEKIEALLTFQMRKENFSVHVEGDRATIETKADIPEEIQKSVYRNVEKAYKY